jgi:hypothetical protein
LCFNRKPAYRAALPTDEVPAVASNNGPSDSVIPQSDISTPSTRAPRRSAGIHSLTKSDNYHLYDLLYDDVHRTLQHCTHLLSTSLSDYKCI